VVQTASLAAQAEQLVGFEGVQVAEAEAISPARAKRAKILFISFKIYCL